jgi:ABC-2 type transport system ATP-binding protein
MKQKLAIAQVFSEPVDILILDEPTSALDPSARVIVLEMVQEARKAGQTVVFSGHVLPEVEQVSDRVAIMRKGRLMHIEDMHVRRGMRMLLVRYAAEEWPAPPREIGLLERERDADKVLYEHRGEVGPLLTWLAGAPIEDIAIGTEDLRSLYDRYHGPNVADEDETP